MGASSIHKGLAALLVLSLAASAPASTALTAPAVVKRSTGFSVSQVQIEGRRNYVAERANDLKRRGIGAPAEILDAASGNQTGSAEAVPTAGDQSYISMVDFGSYSLPVQFDTGSNDPWVFSGELPHDQKEGHVVLPCTQPKVENATWSIQYGGGTADAASGNVIIRDMTVGGATVTRQAVLCATSVGSDFSSDTRFNGVLGLNFDVNASSVPPMPSFLTNLVPTLPLPIFAAALRAGAPGSFDFGYLNASKFTGDIAYTPLVEPHTGDWLIALSGYSVGRDGAKITKTFNIIPDTGTSFSYLDSDLVATYYAGVEGSSNSSGQYTFPCTSALPHFGIFVGQVKKHVPGSTFNAYTTDGGTTCAGGLQVQGNGGDLDIGLLGDSFLKSIYVVYDVGKARVGFADQA